MKTNVLFPILFLFSQTYFSQNFSESLPFDHRLMTIDDRIASVAGKVTLTNEVLAVLETERSNTCIFNVLTDTSAFFAPARLSKYDQYFLEAAAKTALPVERLKAIAFVESGGRPRVRSYAGAVGLMQLMSSTAKHFGASDRTNPEKNIKAGASYLSFLYNLFGQKLCLATASYHMGQGNMNQLIKLALKEFYGIDTVVSAKNSALLVAAYDLSYSKIYFAAKPASALYKRITSLKDWSMDYYFKVSAAEKVLMLDSASFAATYKQIVRSQEKTYRFFTWCQERSFDEDEIIILPFSSKKLYAFLDWPETAPEDEFLGEAKFLVSREAAGAAITVGVLYRELLKKESIPFCPISVDEAFEVPENCKTFSFIMPAPREREAAARFHFVLKRLNALGFLTYKEDEDSFLIIATPERRKGKVLEDIYLEAKKHLVW